MRYKKSKKRQAKQKEQKAKQVEAKEKALYTEAVFQFCKEWEEAHGIDRRGIVGEQYYSAFAQFNAYNSPECEKALEEAILALKMLILDRPISLFHFKIVVATILGSLTQAIILSLGKSRRTSTACS